MSSVSYDAAGVPEITYAKRDGAPVAVVGGRVLESQDALFDAAPGLLAVPNTVELAKAVTHFAYPGRYRVIETPDTFVDDYRARFAAEDKLAPFQEGVAMLSNFEMPELTSIAPPKVTATGLTFFVEDAYLGYPYRVEAPLSDGVLGAPDFHPLPADDD